MNSRLFVHSICTIQSHIIHFQPFLTSFAIFHAFNLFFELNDPDIENLDICYKYGDYNVGFMNRILTLPSYMAPFLAAELSNE